jgi:hypothetical protein
MWPLAHLGLCNNPVEEVRYSLDIRSLEQGKVKVSHITNLLIITSKYVRVSENELNTIHTRYVTL